MTKTRRSSKSSKSKKVVKTSTITTHRNGQAFTEKRPGVCAIILECLYNASEERPVTKAEIVEEILHRLPERDRKRTTNLVGSAPTWLRIYNGLHVSSRRIERHKGFWLDASETAELGRTRLLSSKEGEARA